MRKLLSTAVALGVLASTTMTPAAFADVAAGALPSLNSASNANVTTNGSNMNVQITGGQGSLGTLNWNTYNVGKDAGVNYEFSAHNQTALNKVSATGGLSQIYGRITSSGCAGCGYDGTGKVILINPNGVLFGEGANVNLNSFTVSTLDGYFDKNKNQLILNKGANQDDFGIAVQDGATIHGDKNVTFASKNISLYNGSKISTSTIPNVGDASFGKVKLVTADGVNFTYYNNGAVSKISDIKGSADKMVISMNGDIKSGNIDARNYSTADASEINLKGATLKAVKAVKGNDGNIWLTASNKVLAEDTTLTTVNAEGAEAVKGGNVQILAGKKVSLGTSNINAVGDVSITSQGLDVVVDKTNVNTAKDVAINAARIASVQNGAIVKGKNISVNGGERAQVASSTLNASNDIEVQSAGSMVWTNNAKVYGKNNVNLEATNGTLFLENTEIASPVKTAAGNPGFSNNVTLTAHDNITSAHLEGTTVKAHNMKVESTAENIKLNKLDYNQFKSSGNYPVFKAAKNVEVVSEGDLAVGAWAFDAGKNLVFESTKGNVKLDVTPQIINAEKIYVKAANDVTTPFGKTDVKNIQTNIKAGNDINVKLRNVSDRNNGLVAEAKNNVTITTDGTLSVSKLVAKNGDMTINADKVIAGLPYTTEQKLPGDASERSYIEVGGEFTSNVTNNNFGVTASGELTDDGNYNKKHHIQYGADEKILLVNKRPVDNNVTDPNLPDIDNGDDVEVIKPGQTPVDPTPENPNPDTPNPDDPNPDNPNPDKPNPDNPNPGDCDGDPAEDDVIEEEEAPGLANGQNLLRYTVQVVDQKKH